MERQICGGTPGRPLYDSDRAPGGAVARPGCGHAVCLVELTDGAPLFARAEPAVVCTHCDAGEDR